jgi:S-DNA-T family DNA segregation ATPase FtsK/SpoIIIE
MARKKKTKSQVNLTRTAVEAVLAVLCILAFFSCFSFHLGDWPSSFVSPVDRPTQNWCGPVGAFVAYYLLYYIGPGIFILLAGLIWMLIADIFRFNVDQIWFRLAGLILLTASASATYFLLWPSAALWPYSTGAFPIGNGGILGVGIGSFLHSHLAVLGSTIIIAASWLVGLVLLADKAVISAFKLVGNLLLGIVGWIVPAVSAAKERSAQMGEVWKRLAEKQRTAAARKQTVQQKGASLIEASSLMVDEMLEKKAGSSKSDTEQKKKARQQASKKAQQSSSEQQRKEGKKSLFSKKEKKKKNKPQIHDDDGEVLGPVAEAAQQAAAAGAIKAEGKTEYVPKIYDDYEFPSLDLLTEPEYGFAAVQEKMVGKKAKILEDLLAEFNIDAHVVNAEPGPAITMYELELAAGIKVSQISNLSNDMARALGAGSVRVVAPLPGKHTIGIEVPNSERETVRLKELVELAGNKPDKMQIPIFLGKSSSGEVLLSDLAGMPHLLIAGTTGSGKSVCINSIITSILLTRRPDEVKMILVDPKMVEMAQFDMLPHLMCPIVTDTRRAEQILEWAVTKMDERYELLAEAKVRNIVAYNKLTTEEIIERFNPSTPEEEALIPKKLPYNVIIIDELADLMMTSAKEVESYIVRIAQKSRAVGIHLVVATQRPQATVVTGLIKSNMPARIAFRVAARMDSRIILDQNGGETLLGQGDMLFLIPGTSDLVRSQGAFLDDKEIRNVVKYIKEIAEPQFHPQLMQLNKIDTSAMERDELFDQAVEIVLETKRGSVSLLQRRLSIGYARASRIIEMMAAAGILGEYKGSQAREVTMTADDWQRIKNNMAADAAAGYKDMQEDQEDKAALETDQQQDQDLKDDEDYDDQGQEYDDDDEDYDDDEYEEDDDMEEYQQQEYEDDQMDEEDQYEDQLEEDK